MDAERGRETSPAMVTGGSTKGKGREKRDSKTEDRVRAAGEGTHTRRSVPVLWLGEGVKGP